MHSIGSEKYYEAKAGKLLVDQVEAMESVAIGGVLGTVNLAILSAWISRHSVMHAWIFAWLAVKLLASVGLLWAEFRQRGIPVTEKNAKRRLLRLTASPTINGVLWSVGLALMWEPDNLPIQLVLMLFTMGMAAAALLELKPHLPALFGFFMPSTCGIIFATLWNHDQNTVLVILSTVIFIIWSIRHAIIENKRLIRSLQEQFEIADLTIRLREQNTITEAATNAKSRFLAAASHDLRQPMHALNLYLGALNNFDLPSAARPVLDKVRECAKTMDDMFGALLDISRLDASVLSPNFSTFPISIVLNKIHVEFSQQAQAKGVELRVAPCSALVTSDMELLENILRNLVSNAVRYTQSGKILVGCRRTGLGVRLGVYDTGIGIAREMQPAIFEEFFQVQNQGRDRAQGLGLGLAIAQRQARLLRSPITLQSEAGRGSVFEMALQLNAATPALAQALPGQPMNDHNLQGALIVVIDDESIILDAARMVLEQWGCEVIAARSVEETLKNLETITRVPDAIICDHRLRDDATGVEVIGMLRNEFSSDIPALLITGDTSPEQMKDITSAGFNVMHKPLQSQVLQRLLLEMIGSRAQVQD